eukprot:SAG22_NODE_1242_length_5026_cov_2.748731_1_plen_261_part_00
MDGEMQSYFEARESWFFGYYVEFLIACVAPALMLRHYADPYVHWLIFVICGGAWTLSFSLLLLAPVDISETMHARCVHTSYEWVGMFELAGGSYTWENYAAVGIYDDLRMNAVLLPSKTQELSPETVGLAENIVGNCAVGVPNIDTNYCRASQGAVTHGAVLVPDEHRLYQLQMDENSAVTQFRIDVPKLPPAAAAAASSGGDARRWFALFTEHLPYEFVDPDVTSGMGIRGTVVQLRTPYRRSVRSVLIVLVVLSDQYY